MADNKQSKLNIKIVKEKSFGANRNLEESKNFFLFEF